MDEIARLLRRQDGVVSRRQLRAAGRSDEVIAGQLRRHDLATVHPGVYVEHTGEPTPAQRRWAAVLACWPAALTHSSAVGPFRRHGAPALLTERLVHVAVDRGRHLVAPRGVRVHRLQDFDARVRWELSPPRVRVEDAVLLCAAGARDDLAAVAVVADACGSGAAKADRLLARLEQLTRLPRRAWLRSVLHDVEAGTCSVLEHGYLVRVERAHGLPVGERQAPAPGHRGATRRDVRYADTATIVELDGRLTHAQRAQWYDDLQRDLLSAADRAEETLRVGWPQVYGPGDVGACATARLVGAVLVRRGWAGPVTPCRLCGRSPVGSDR